MKRLDRFILKSFILPFFGVLIIVVFILMMQFLWLYIDELVGKGLGLKVILEFLFWGSSTMLPISLPLATLLSAVMTMGQMSENNELIAIKSAGISLKRVLLPLGIATAVICVATFFAANNLVPVAFNKIYTLRDDIGKTKDEINIPTGTFYDGLEGYVMRINDRDKKSGMMHGVMVYDHTGNKGNTSITIADSALMKMSASKTYILFELFSGISYQETNTFKYRDTTLQLNRVNFDRQKMVIPLNNYAFEKSNDTRYSDQVKTKPVSRLAVDRDSAVFMRDSILTQRKIEFMKLRYIDRHNQLDTSAHFNGKTNYDISKMDEWQSLDKEKDAYDKAAQTASDLYSRVRNYHSDVYEYVWTVNHAGVELLKKFAQSFACFLLFLIGAPLGAAATKKKGLGASAIVAVLFFVLYWVVDITGIKLANDGAVSSALGAFNSTLVLLPIGLYLTWKAIHDSALLNTDEVTTLWRKFKSKITGMFKKTRIVYMGTPEFAVAPLDALVKAGYNVVGVVTVADKPSGRGLKVNESAVKKYAVEHNIPVLQPVKLKDPEFLEQLAAFKADLFVVVAFRMLPEVVWTMPPLGTFNLHAALLPQYRGAAPINWAVINGERVTGVTTFMIDQEIDTGGIMLRQNITIEDCDTAGDLHDKMMPVGAELVLQTVEGIIEKNIEKRVQRSFIQGSEVLKPAPKLTRELCHIDWNASTTEVYNLIRGLSPYPTAFTEIVKEEQQPMQLKIFKAEKKTLSEVGGKEGTLPGTILTDGKTHLSIATKDGALSLTDIQLQGKKRMDVKSFLAGFRDAEAYTTTKGTSSAEIAKTRA